MTDGSQRVDRFPASTTIWGGRGPTCRVPALGITSPSRRQVSVMARDVSTNAWRSIWPAARSARWLRAAG